MPTFEEMYLFLSDYYLHSRFSGSLNVKDFPDYAQQVTKSSMEQLSITGVGYISKYDSRTGRVIIFDKYLQILNKDEPPSQIQASAPHLTHILGK